MLQLNVPTSEVTSCREPEIRYLGESGTALCQFGIAHTRNFQRNGEWQKETSFFDVKAWGTVAERAATLGKGDEVICSGRLVQERWEGKDGGQRSKITLIKACTGVQ